MAESVHVRCLRNPDIEIYQFRELERAFPSHFHEGLLLGCLLRGRRIMILPDRELTVSPGALIYLPPGTPHACRPASRETVDWICIQMYSPAHDWLPRQPFITTDRNLAAKLAAIAAERMEAKVLPGINELLLDMARRCREEMPVNNAGEAKRALPRMAREQQMDKFQYLRNFRKAMGITPGRYGESLRANRAKSLIKAGFSLVEAAAEFCDQSHLNRVFKKNLGVTPGAMRAAYAREDY